MKPSIFKLKRSKNQEFINLLKFKINFRCNTIIIMNESKAFVTEVIQNNLHTSMHGKVCHTVAGAAAEYDGSFACARSSDNFVVVVFVFNMISRNTLWHTF